MPETSSCWSIGTEAHVDAATGWRVNHGLYPAREEECASGDAFASIPRDGILRRPRNTSALRLKVDSREVAVGRAEWGEHAAEPRALRPSCEPAYARDRTSESRIETMHRS